MEDRVEELERDLDKYEKDDKPKDGSTTDQKDSKKKEYRGGHSKASSRASEAIDAAKYKAELQELRAQLQQQKGEIGELKEGIKAKDKKEVDLRKEIGKQTQTLIQVKEELLAKNEKVLQLETQVEELAGIRAKNQKLEDHIRQLKKELEAIKRERAEWETEQLLLLQREKNSSKQSHPQLQQDLNQSGFSNLSGYGANLKGKQLLDRSESKQHFSASRMPNSIENPNAAQQFLVLEKQRFNSLEKLAGLGGSVSSTTGGGPNKGSQKL